MTALWNTITMRNVWNVFFRKEYMSELMREDFLKRFTGNEGCDLNTEIAFEIEEEEDKILIGFCVMGGIFSQKELT